MRGKDASLRARPRILQAISEDHQKSKRWPVGKPRQGRTAAQGAEGAQSGWGRGQSTLSRRDTNRNSAKRNPAEAGHSLLISR